MTIAVGDRIPEIDVRVIREGAQVVLPSTEVLGSGRVVLFAVPGAFTPGCHKQHLPGFVAQAADISAAGVDSIVCIGVNDAFVMDAWGTVQNVGDSILMVADPAADFAKAIGMEVDASGAGLGIRSQRYAMVIEDGVVTAFMPEEGGFKIEASTADCVLTSLKG
jgi:peroxiredoxin